jgi:hypothetical protein
MQSVEATQSRVVHVNADGERRRKSNELIELATRKRGDNQTDLVEGARQSFFANRDCSRPLFAPHYRY